MTNIILTALIVVCGVVVAIVSPMELFDKNRTPFWKKFKPTYWVVFTATVTSITLGFLKDHINAAQARKEEIYKDSINHIGQVLRDSLNRDFTQKSNNSIIATFASKLAEYNLHFDSTQNRIEKIIKDSANKKPDYTFVDLCAEKPIYIKNHDKSDKKELHVYFCNTGSYPAYDFKGSIYYILKYRKNSVIKSEKITSLKLTLGVKDPYQFSIGDLTLPKAQDYDFYLYVTGKWYNYSRTVLQNFNSLMKFYTPDSSWVIPVDNEYEDLNKYIVEHGLK